MANVYQVKIVSIEATANGMLNADCFVQLRTGTSPNFVYTDAQNGHFTIVLEASDVMAIINNPANSTNVLKRQAIRDLIKTKALERGIDKSDEAFIELSKFMNYPDAVVIRQ